MSEFNEYLSQFITEDRLIKLQKVLGYRTRYLTVVLEDIYQSHNASAVLRTADCFGIQDVHIIENRNEYTINPDVALGSSQWLNLIRYREQKDNTQTAINQLKSNGYRIVSTVLGRPGVHLENFDINRGKTAILFGNELTGLSDKAIEMSDEFIQIPMYGFTESFNISVSAAIIMHFLSNLIRKSQINWCLNEQEREEILTAWLKRSIKRVDLLEKDYYQKKSEMNGY